ncbi:MAG: hybrid sensor histidine kinase/response regulator [Microcoleaceae cyanobacterium]
MIEDDELRLVFKSASEEHLQKLDDGFLHLEKHPDDTAKLEELLRETHSLKGDAGMLGVKDVSTLSHQMEHLLGSVKRGETKFTSEISDRLCQGLDALRRLVNEAVTGEASGVNTFYALANLMGATTSPATHKETKTPPTPQEESLQPQPEAQPEEPAEGPPEAPLEAPPESLEKTEEIESKEKEEDHPPDVTLSSQAEKLPIPSPQITTPQVTAPTYRIESVRVATQNLDALMTQAGELTVTKIRLAHRLAEIEELTAIAEEWNRDAFLHRLLLQEVDNDQNGYSSNAMSQLQKYHQRAEERLDHLSVLINKLRTGVYEDTARLDLIADELEEGIRTLRLLPLSNIFSLFPRMVRDLGKQEKKQVELVIEGGDTRADKRILEEMKDPLMHMIRNAIDHGIEPPEERVKLGKTPHATIRLKGYQTTTNIVIEVSDDGRGLDIERIKQTAIKRGICQPEELNSMTNNQIQSLIFAPGFSTRNFVTEVSGRGVGLDVVRTNVEGLKGSIQVDSIPGKGCTLRLQLSTTLATAHVLIVAVDGISYAFPVEFVQTTRLISETDIFCIEGRQTILLDNQPVSVARLSDLLPLSPLQRQWSSMNAEPQTQNGQKLHNQDYTPCLIIKVGEERLGLFVDGLIDEQDVMLKPQSHLLKRVRNVTGSTILGTGEVCMVLNPQDLIKSVRKQAIFVAVTSVNSIPEEKQKKQLILLAEDSIATRTQEKRILENAGYEVVTAVDGLDAFNKLKTREFDAVVSDVQMPNLDGLGLTAKIRQLKEYSELPIILVTSLASDEDKRRGADVGANAYITKGTFNQEVLLETLRRLA